MKFKHNQPVVRVCPDGHRILCIYLQRDYEDRILVLENYNDLDHGVSGVCNYALGLNIYTYDKQTYSELKRTLKIVKETSILSFLYSDILHIMLEYRKEKLKRILK